MARYIGLWLLPIAAIIVLLSTSAAKSDCGRLTSDSNMISGKAKNVEAYEKSGDEFNARTAWNSMNHYALLGAQEFRVCNDTMPRLLYSVAFANASAIGMYYGLLPWPEGTSNIGGSLQIIDALPHTPVVEKEWKLIDRLYLKTCGMHHASCKPRTYRRL